MKKKTITPRKMIDALRYGKRVRQTTGAYTRFISRNNSDYPAVIGSACALGKIGLTLNIFPELESNSDLASSLAGNIVTWNDELHLTFSEIADRIEKEYASDLDTPFEVGADTNIIYPVLEIDRG